MKSPALRVKCKTLIDGRRGTRYDLTSTHGIFFQRLPWFFSIMRTSPRTVSATPYRRLAGPSSSSLPAAVDAVAPIPPLLLRVPLRVRLAPSRLPESVLAAPTGSQNSGDHLLRGNVCAKPAMPKATEFAWREKRDRLCLCWRNWRSNRRTAPPPLGQEIHCEPVLLKRAVPISAVRAGVTHAVPALRQLPVRPPILP